MIISNDDKKPSSLGVYTQFRLIISDKLEKSHSDDKRGGKDKAVNGWNHFKFFKFLIEKILVSEMGHACLRD